MNEIQATMEETTSSDIRTEEETTTVTEVSTETITADILEATTSSVVTVEPIDYTDHIETLITVNLLMLLILTFALGYMITNSFFRHFK